MSGRFPSTAGAAAGASGMFTVTILRPASKHGRGVAEHWAYGERAHAMDDLGWLLERVAPGTELVLKDPEGAELLRAARTA